MTHISYVDRSMYLQFYNLDRVSLLYPINILYRQKSMDRMGGKYRRVVNVEEREREIEIDR